MMKKNGFKFNKHKEEKKKKERKDIKTSLLHVFG